MAGGFCSAWDGAQAHLASFAPPLDSSPPEAYQTNYEGFPSNTEYARDNYLPWAGGDNVVAASAEDNQAGVLVSYGGHYAPQQHEDRTGAWLNDRRNSSWLPADQDTVASRQKDAEGYALHTHHQRGTTIVREINCPVCPQSGVEPTCSHSRSLLQTTRNAKNPPRDPPTHPIAS